MTGREWLERLLRQRGRQLDEQPLLAAQRDAATRAEVAALVQAELARERRRRWVLWVAPLAAAAALLMYVGLHRDAPRHYGRVDAQIALLDEAGRRLQSAVRGVEQTTTAATELLVELVPADSGYAYVFFYDERGRRTAQGSAAAIPLVAGADVLRAFPLPEPEAAPADRAAARVLGVWVVLSEREVSRETLEAMLPGSIDTADPGAWESAAREVEQHLGCSVQVHRLVFASRPPSDR